MINGIQFKVCGLTSSADAEAAGRAGADYLGFNFYPASPRHISFAQFGAIAPSLPQAKRVAVMVEPSSTEFARIAGMGFDFYQIHFRHDLPESRIEIWSEAAGPDRLWLAPKLPPSVLFQPAWIPRARYFLIDAFSPELFGGTGRTADWAGYSRLRSEHPDREWILAGGLNPGNIGEALKRTGARLVDANSGVESSPGIKDHAKVRAFADAIRLVTP